MTMTLKQTVTLCLILLSCIAFADDAELTKAKEFFGTAGVPGDKWIEGETFYPHVAPGQHFFRALQYYAGTEELQPDEMRVTFMGSNPWPSQSQSGMSIFVELGNGENFEILEVGDVVDHCLWRSAQFDQAYVLHSPAHGSCKRPALLPNVSRYLRWMDTS